MTRTRPRKLCKLRRALSSRMGLEAQAAHEDLELQIAAARQTWGNVVAGWVWMAYLNSTASSISRNS